MHCPPCKSYTSVDDKCSPARAFICVKLAVNVLDESCHMNHELEQSVKSKTKKSADFHNIFIIVSKSLFLNLTKLGFLLGIRTLFVLDKLSWERVERKCSAI